MISYLVPLLQEGQRGRGRSGGTYLAAHTSPAHEDGYSGYKPCSVFPHANPRASGSVATGGVGRRTDTARRGSGDATASSPISWTLSPYVNGRIASVVKRKQRRASCPFGRS